MTITTTEIINILLAVLVGGAIGLERELHHKAAGFRTITLICIGATIITMLDSQLQATGRISANIVTGIGFLGAGVILRDTNRIKGLTTSAYIWVSASLGIAIGAGFYLLAIGAAAIILIVMYIFRRLESWIDNRWDIRFYKIVMVCDQVKVEQVEVVLRRSGLRLGLHQKMKVNGRLECTWEASGATQKQNSFVEALINDPEIQEIKW
jgi:putative Mg2+ transporter-C (MgtC) family protein